MEVSIKTLTPLWTGGVKAGKCDRIHETGILGSLRWWMEVLVRGMGGQVKDPTAEKSEDRSSLDPNKFDAKIYRQLQDEFERRQYLHNAGLCDVSQIFGATGWKHRFRLEVKDKNTHSVQLQDNYRSLSAREGELSIKVQSLDPNFDLDIIGGLIQFIADWSAVGARPQLGFGVIKIVNADTSGQSILQSGRIPTRSLYNWLTTNNKNKPDRTLPSLKNIFLAQIQVSRSSTKQDAFKHLKNDLHHLFAHDQRLHDFMMGTAQGKRMAAKIKISHAYEDDNCEGKLMRVWGWVPAQAEVYKNGWDREKIVGAIYQHLAANYTLHEWREMNSARDSVKSKENNVQAFLRSLLGLKESSDAV